MLNKKIKKHEDVRRIINVWLCEILYGCTISISTAFEVYGRNLYIYTNRPGILIGLKGKNIDNLRNRLPKYIKHIHFIELGNTSYTKEVTVKRKLF